MEDILLKLQEIVTIYGLKILAAIIIFVIGRIAAKALRRFIVASLRKSKADEALILTESK